MAKKKKRPLTGAAKTAHAKAVAKRRSPAKSTTKKKRRSPAKSTTKKKRRSPAKKTTKRRRKRGGGSKKIGTALKAALPVAAGVATGVLLPMAVRRMVMPQLTGWQANAMDAAVVLGTFMALRKVKGGKFAGPALAGGVLLLGARALMQYAPEMASKVGIGGGTFAPANGLGRINEGPFPRPVPGRINEGPFWGRQMGGIEAYS